MAKHIPNVVQRRIKLAKKEQSTELDLSFCDLTKFPEAITRLVNLTSLDLRGNQLTELPDSITRGRSQLSCNFMQF